jgi:cell fate (sporulation/competence/biofilm development) regulator YlbF (YheA/YmcA/DUF963 family)
MTVVADQLCETIQSLKHAAQSALANEAVEEFSNVERYVNEIEGYARELQQSLWADEARGVIRRLEKNEPLTPADQDVIRAMLISDAEGYIANENNFNDWVAELNRLIKDLERRASNVNRKSIADFRGVLHDAIRLIPDIRNYFTEKRRIEKFENAISSFDKSSRELLHRLLNEKLRCPKR